MQRKKNSKMSPATTGLEFLSGGGEMGERIRRHDWGATPLGDPATWPQSLKTALRVLLSTGHPMFIWWGPKLIQFYNDAYRRSIGPERHPSALGQEGRECWAEIWPIIGPQIEQVMSGGGHTWHENQLVPITRHGRREDVYWTYSYGPIDDAAAPNGIGGVLVVCTETTEQVLAEQRLKLAERRWRALFSQAPGFMGILNGPEHRFEFANERYFELVGKRDIIGKPVAEALPEVTAQGFIELLDTVYRSGVPYHGQSIPVELARGSGEIEQRFVDFMYEPIRDSAGMTVGILVEGYDVTDRVRADEALRLEDQRKDEFLAMLAHELRNPLAPIRNAGEFLLTGPGIADEVRHAGRIVCRQVTQLTRLVDDLLDISRISTGRIELRFEPVEIGHVVGLAIEEVAPEAAAKRQTVSFDARGERLYVQADLARLVQSVSNILNNAVKYSHAGSGIEVSVRRDDGSAVIRVADQGIGIDADMLPKVFDLFSQDERTLDRAQGGLGIGLAVVHRLIGMHGGSVLAKSEGRGKGSVFEISLPLVPASEDAPGAPPAAGRALQRRILIVDDNADAADSLAQLLRVAGQAVEVAYDSESALARAPEFAGEVILLDIGLPGRDGYDVARQLRTQGFDGLLVAVTGYSQESDIRRAADAGFDAHLAKPVALKDLLKLL